MKQLFLFVAVLVLEASACAARAATSVIPAEAAEAIASVNAAATQNDFTQLRSLMIKKFIWSLGYGADADADQAIAAWRTDPAAMTALRQVTSMPCGYISNEIIQCPLDAGVAYRAGFTRAHSGWRMSHFLAGD